MIKRSEVNEKLGKLFLKYDQNPDFVLGYNEQKGGFVTINKKAY